MDTATFTAPAIRKLAVLINCFSVIGSQLVAQREGTLNQGHANLLKFKNENAGLLQEVHTLALKGNAESALRLIEDLERPASADVGYLLGLTKRCLLASVFLSHCIARSGDEMSLTPSETASEQRLH
jgi:hypothetical protein